MIRRQYTYRFFTLFLFLSSAFLVSPALSEGGECICIQNGGSTEQIPGLTTAESCVDQQLTDASGQPVSEITGCQWIPGQCWCETNENGVEQTGPISDVASPSACTDAALNAANPSIQFSGCQWRRERTYVSPQASQRRPIPELEPLFATGTAQDIAGLNQFPGKNVPTLIGTIIKTGMSVIGIVALVLFVYGGVSWMLARGNSDRQQQAFDTLLWGGIGIVVMFASYVLVDYVFEAFR